MELVVLLLLAVLVYALVIVGFGIVRPVVAGDTCRRCAYATAGLISEVCPECGVPLLVQPGETEDVLRPPLLVKWISRGLLLLLASAIVFIATIALVPEIERAWVSGVDYRRGYTLRIYGEGWRECRPSDRWRGTLLMRHVRLEVTTSGSPQERATIELVNPMRAGVMTDARGRRVETPNTITVSQIQEWAQGFTTTKLRADLAASAVEIDRTLTHCVLGYDAIPGSLGGRTSYPVPRWGIPLGAAYIVVLGIAVRWMGRRGPIRVSR
jgi:hypothetical protein